MTILESFFQQITTLFPDDHGNTSCDQSENTLVNISFLSLFLFSNGLKSALEEISQKFNFMLKGTVLGKFLKAFRALNERPPRNVMKQFINGGF